ncbi:hypothetical protein ACFVIM_05460 [Streptomyces sp. NPDC057638]|uniref:hypothetical protein n=1 Tax=Streptomyces sp. NPDC057638 TaxID=3346190 RepID=UPI0036AB3247
MAARRAMDFAMGAERNQVGMETLDYLQSEVRRIAGIHLRVPVGAVLDDLVHVQDRTFRLLESGRARPAQIRELYVLATLECGMLAKASHDLGEPQAAMAQARTAAVCADQAEHAALRAWVRGLQSMIAYWGPRPEDALHYARHGAALAEGLRGTVAVWLAAHEARAAALLGDAEAVWAADRRAETLRERTEPDDLDSLGGNFFFPRARQMYSSVEAHVLLRADGPDLLRRAEDAVGGLSDATSPSWSFAAEAGCRANLAVARLRTGDVEGTAEAMRPVLDLPPARRNAGIVGSVHRVRALLTSPGSGPAGDLREEIAAFSTRRGPALPV